MNNDRPSLNVEALSNTIKHCIVKYCEIKNIDLEKMARKISDFYCIYMDDINALVRKYNDDPVNLIALFAALSELGCDSLNRLFSNLARENALPNKEIDENTSIILMESNFPESGVIN